MNMVPIIKALGVALAAVLPGGSLVLAALLVSRWLRARKLLPTAPPASRPSPASR